MSGRGRAPGESVPDFDSLQHQLFHVEDKLDRLLTLVSAMSAELDRLKASVTKLTDVNASVVALLQNLAQQVRDNATDPAALKKLADDVDAQASALAKAVTDNTPTPPAPPTP